MVQCTSCPISLTITTKQSTKVTKKIVYIYQKYKHNEPVINTLYTYLYSVDDKYTNSYYAIKSHNKKYTFKRKSSQKKHKTFTKHKKYTEVIGSTQKYLRNKF